MTEREPMGTLKEKASTDGDGRSLANPSDVAVRIYHSDDTAASACEPVMFEMAEENCMQSQGLIKGLLPESPLSLLVGESQTGKSGIAIEMAACVSSGFPFLGLEVSQTPVVYLVGEGSRDKFMNRVTAVRRRFETERRGQMQAAFLHGHFDLVRNVGSVVDAAYSCASALRGRYGKRAGLVIVDTLSSMSLGTPENTPEGMGAILAGLGRLSSSLDASVLALHHPALGNKKDGPKRLPRGHGSLYALCDACLYADGKVLSIVKTRDDDPSLVLGYKRRTVYLARSSTYVVDLDETAATAKPSNVSNDMKVYSELVGNPNYRNLREIAVRVGLAPGSVSNALGRLANEGYVRKTGEGKKARFEPLARVALPLAA
ncbi:AAA family ATPase [Rhodomicrobium sp.]|uniref:AAA family ATPase n=1 Tax=Rhodomicrobium sp. TaxID=2720632 RepID=UPI0039E604DB